MIQQSPVNRNTAYLGTIRQLKTNHPYSDETDLDRYSFSQSYNLYTFYTVVQARLWSQISGSHERKEARTCYTITNLMCCHEISYRYDLSRAFVTHDHRLFHLPTTDSARSIIVHVCYISWSPQERR
jgi:hypothetical protein